MDKEVRKSILKYAALFVAIVVATIVYKQCTSKPIEPAQTIAQPKKD